MESIKSFAPEIASCASSSELSSKKSSNDISYLTPSKHSWPKLIPIFSSMITKSNSIGPSRITSSIKKDLPESKTNSKSNPI
jgi:hypothetical protein